MDKLLHERLRDAIDEANSECVEDVDVYVGNAQVSLYLDGAHAIADEIERCYIPRPRFEDGEPVQFGEEFESRNDGNKYTVNFIGRGSNGVGRVASCKNGCGMTAEEPLKRPTPKVYDADGVEIKVGDIVYAFECDLKGKVLYFDVLNGSVQTDVGKFKPEQLTHEKPVFDAEGVRICKGDTVYDVDGINTEPMRVLSYGDALVNVMSKSGIEKDYEFNELTYREPDSLEKLRDYVREQEEQEFSGARDVYHEIGDRLTAIIERGA